MSKKHNRNKPAPKKQQESLFQEAWGNMSEDMARVMPDFLVKGLKGGKRKTWVIVIVTLVELLVLGAVGKFIYDWFAK